jgi:hypothetical protein
LIQIKNLGGVRKNAVRLAANIEDNSAALCAGGPKRAALQAA